MGLISQIPNRGKKNDYGHLIETDPRLNREEGIDVGLNSYLFNVKKTVNPQGKDLKVLYGCSGADCITPLLSTDASEFIFVDLTKINLNHFKEALNIFINNNEYEIAKRLTKDSFISLRARYGGTMSSCDGNGTHNMNDLAFRFLFDLQLMGVELKDITLSTIEDKQGVQVGFTWKYHGAFSARKRCVNFITADITKPKFYPPILQAEIDKGLDAFYMKAAFLVPENYPDFLPIIAGKLNKGGWFLTCDKTFKMDDHNPEKLLKDLGYDFETVTSDEIDMCKEMMQPPHDPLVDVPILKRLPRFNQRAIRTIGSDLTYWSILNLRQKKS